jgi:hypothetical protein
MVVCYFDVYILPQYLAEIRPAFWTLPNDIGLSFSYTKCLLSILPFCQTFSRSFGSLSHSISKAIEDLAQCLYHL